MMSKTKLIRPLKGFRDFLPIKIAKNARVGVFIDEANLFYIQKELGWKIDWQKLSDFIGKDVDLKILRYYLGMPTSGKSRIQNVKHLRRLESFGYTVITKPLKKILIDRKAKKYKNKCNFDVEIALDVATFIKELDLIIIASGDSDFIAIKDFVLSNDKKVVFLCYEKNVSWEIRYAKFIFIERIKKFIELK
jgi:uncharacterized LabA/DUF88 family protein